ncbi:MAG: amidohydrolase family protein [Acidimicrobiales bacterium]|jgi:predicted TIM-barrel fold metal-dependent hydrolase|nr:amidohydrolase family protein [Acidimicrobiales bacterium]
MTTVDCHLHLGLIDEHTPAWWWWEQFGFEPTSVGGVEIVQFLDETNIDIGLIQGGDIRRNTYHPDYLDDRNMYVPNDYTARQCAMFPDRLFGVIGIDPLVDVYASLDEIDRCVEKYDFKVLKLLPTYHHYRPDDRRLDPFYEKCLSFDIPVQIHLGWTRTTNTTMEHQRPVYLDRLGRDFPDLKVVVAHLGHPWVDEAIAVIAKHPNFYTELSGWGPYGMAPHDPVGEAYKALKKLKSYECLNKVMFGSDNTDCKDMYQAANAISLASDEAPLISEDVYENIMGKTACQLFKLVSTGGDRNDDI